MRRLDGNAPAREKLGERGDDVPRSLVELHPLHVTRRLGVPKVGVERRRACRIDQHRRVGALETREIAHVDQPGDEQGLLEARGEALDPVHPSLRSASIASARR